MVYKNNLLKLVTAATITITPIITPSCMPCYTQPKIWTNQSEQTDKTNNLENITINNYHLYPGSQFMIRGSLYYFDRYDARSSMYFFYTTGHSGRLYFSWNMHTLNNWARERYFYPHYNQNMKQRPFNKYDNPVNNNNPRSFDKQGKDRYNTNKQYNNNTKSGKPNKSKINNQKNKTAPQSKRKTK